MIYSNPNHAQIQTNPLPVCDSQSLPAKSKRGINNTGILRPLGHMDCSHSDCVFEIQGGAGNERFHFKGSKAIGIQSSWGHGKISAVTGPRWGTKYEDRSVVFLSKSTQHSFKSRDYGPSARMEKKRRELYSTELRERRRLIFGYFIGRNSRFKRYARCAAIPQGESYVWHRAFWWKRVDRSIS